MAGGAGPSSGGGGGGSPPSMGGALKMIEAKFKEEGNIILKATKLAFDSKKLFDEISK
jgi:hypothetical protein